MAATPEDRHPARGLLTKDDWEHVAAVFELSRREREVAELLFSGSSRWQMALQLHKRDGTTLSPETVRVYVDRLYQKMRVQDTAEMTLRILTSLSWFQQAVHKRNCPQTPAED